MPKKSGGKAAKTKTDTGKITLPAELGGASIAMKTLLKHPIVATLAADALEAMAADIRAKLARASAPAPAANAKPAAPKAAKPVAAKPATAKPAARRAPRKPTAPGTDTTQ